MRSLLLILTLVILNETAFSQSYYTETGTAIFHSKVPLHTFSGSSSNLTGLINLDEGTVDFYLDLETLDTGNGKRDKDMRLTLETDKYPFGEFFGQLIGDFDPNLNQPQDVEVEGVFKIHGKEQNVQIQGQLTPEGEQMRLTAAWILELEDYEIEPPKLLFIKVDQQQEIEINALLIIKE